jgi:hypothetical protein
MVAKELLEELRSIRRNFDWKYDGRSRKIRANLKSQPDGVVFDPIGAVCYSKTGRTFDEGNWFQAAEEIGLSHIDAGDLTAAANNVTYNPNHHYTDTLRRQMIDDVLLQPERNRTDFDSPHAVLGYLSMLFGKHAKPNMTSGRVG